MKPSTVKRVTPPTFFPVPAGTPAERCSVCSEPVYRIEALDARGKRTDIDCAVVGGRAPSPTAGGLGVLHFIYCTAPARSYAARREHSPL